MHVTSARWDRAALRTQVTFVATAEDAYSAQWRKQETGELRYTLTRNGASMWVLLRPDDRERDSPGVQLSASTPRSVAGWLGADDISNRRCFTAFLRNRGIPQPGSESDSGLGVLCAELSFRRYQSGQNARKTSI